MAANEIWSMDFVSDAMVDGRPLRALTVVDAFTRECRKRSRAALLPVGTGFVVSPTKLWGIEPALWSTLLTTRKVACIAGWRS
jgi:hypothetical protein